MTTKKVEQDYNADSVKVLKGLTGIRKRPTMYVGSVDEEGLIVIGREGIDNSVDEALAGYGKLIEIDVSNETGEYTITDYGRGVPVDIHKTEKIPAIEVLVTQMHAGGKFGGSAYQTSGGLNGIGIKATNALSQYFSITSYREGKSHQLEFKKGIKQGKMKVTPLKKNKKRTGTTVTFISDPDIFDETELYVPTKEMMVEMLQQRSYLNPTVTFKLTYDGEVSEYHSPGGLSQFVGDMRTHADKGVLFKKVISFEGDFHTPMKDDETGETVDALVGVNLAFCYDTGYDSSLLGFCNTIPQRDGGTHITGFRMSLPTLIKKYIADNKIAKTKADQKLVVEGVDCLEGLTMVVSVSHPDPKYRGQEKQKLSNHDIQGFVQKLVNANLVTWMSENPNEAKIICQKALNAAKGRLAAKTAKESTRKTASLGFAGLHDSKLADCISEDPLERELLLVEGDSAGGSVKQGREKNTQAVFPLRGKPLNSLGVHLNKVMANKETSDLMLVLGTGVGSEFDIEKSRYTKIIIMADADVDGSHIRTLLDTFFWCHARDFLEAGYVYLANPPLFKVVESSKSTIFVKDDEALAKYLVNRMASRITLNASFEYQDSDPAEHTMTKAQLGKTFVALEKYRHLVDAAVSAYGLTVNLIETALACEDGDEVVATLREELKESGGQFYEESGEQVSSIFEDDFVSIRFTEELKADMMEIIEAVGEAIGWVYELDEDADGVSLEITTKAGVVTEYTPHALAVELQRVADKSVVSITYLKGLGEMNPDELWDTTLNPEIRVLTRLTVSDVEDTQETVELFMHKKNPHLRREAMEDNHDAFETKDLDI
jgi:DNA gyrase subunit B